MYPYAVLIVEDEKAIRENYVTFLKMSFESVYEASDGEEGLEIYKKSKPHILIVDIHLPHMSGLELLRRVRESDFNTKAIVLSAHTDTQFLLEANELKLTKYLVKPVDRKELKESLRLVVEELQNFRVEHIKKVDLTSGYSWDMELSLLRHYNNTIELTKKEQRLLKLLFSKKGRVFTHEEIYDYVWDEIGKDGINYAGALKTIVKNFRKKISIELIESLYGEGYRINIIIF